jgi:hypothetical protein
MGHHQHHTNIYALQNNPSIGWVHPKFTHGHPLACGNNNITKPSTHTYTNRATMRQSLLLHIDRVTTPSTLIELQHHQLGYAISTNEPYLGNC